MYILIHRTYTFSCTSTPLFLPLNLLLSLLVLLHCPYLCPCCCIALIFVLAVALQTMLLTETGFIPWKLDGGSPLMDVSQGVSSPSSSSSSSLPPSSLHGDNQGNYGRLTYEDILAVYTSRDPSDHVTKGGGWTVPRLLGPLKATSTTKDQDKDKDSIQKLDNDKDKDFSDKKYDDRYPLATAYCVSFGSADPR